MNRTTNTETKYHKKIIISQLNVEDFEQKNENETTKAN